MESQAGKRFFYEVLRLKDFRGGEDLIFRTISNETKIPHWKIENTINLLEADMTIPFIARYRKEQTGELDEVQIRQIDDLYKFYRALEQKKSNTIRLIDEQGKLTEDLKLKILAATKVTEVEDLYRPYRPKRKTRASVAKDNGLEPLANYLLSLKEGLIDPETEAEKYLSETILTVPQALQGAKDIIAEMVADDPDARAWVRQYSFNNGVLITKAKAAAKNSVYQMYDDYQEPVKRIVPHRILAINRGEKEEYLRVSIEIPAEAVLSWLNRRFNRSAGAAVQLINEAISDGYKRLLAPAIERDLRNELTEKAEAQATIVFSKNLRSLLLQPPVKGKVCLAIDPAYRTGCKLAVVDTTGKLLETGVIYPTPPQKRIAEAKQELRRLIERYKPDALVLGNGTASRETESFIVEFIEECGKDLAYTIVNEAGASVYSASELAAKEFPGLDVSQRSAVSLARRIQDPLAELVKIDPKSIGVGQYQHDIAPKRLDENLAAVVESVVNYIGVNINTASPSLLRYVAGINATVAENIVKYREEKGVFGNRKDLRKVAKLGPKAFQQAAGFLRIPDGETPLDNTSVHPESYDLTRRLLKMTGLDLQNLGSAAMNEELRALNIEEMAKKLEAGVPTLRDIVESLMRPGRDPREDMPPPVFRKDVLNMEDLQIGMEFQGVVRNAVDFGIFVDIGVKQDGLVHISEISNRRIKHPLEIVAIGDVISVRVIGVDLEKGRISLTMKNLS